MSAFDPKRTLRQFGPFLDACLDRYDDRPEPRGPQMRRREFITLIGGAVAVWPLAAYAQQQGRLRRVALFMNLPENDGWSERCVSAFRRGLADLGWIEGRNIRIDYRFATGDPRSVPVSVAELVALKPDVILASASEVLAAFLKATSSIPIVFVSVSDPVGQGFVASLDRPGGHITGFTAFEFSMGGKWVELLKEIAPSIQRVAIVFNPKTAPYFSLFVRSIQMAAVSFGVEAVATPVHDLAEIESVITAFAHEPNRGLICPSDSFTSIHRKPIIALAERHAIPAVFSWREFVTDGALIGYGIDRVDMYRRSPSYVDRILKGAKPADLPVQQPTKFELAVNVKTAKAIGVAVPPGLLARADEVIE
jgi:putative ABC transport system substrate-binding protein